MRIVEATAADSHAVLSVERLAFAREDEAVLVAVTCPSSSAH